MASIAGPMVLFTILVPCGSHGTVLWWQRLRRIEHEPQIELRRGWRLHRGTTATSCEYIHPFIIVYLYIRFATVVYTNQAYHSVIGLCRSTAQENGCSKVVQAEIRYRKVGWRPFNCFLSNAYCIYGICLWTQSGSTQTILGCSF